MAFKRAAGVSQKKTSAPGEVTLKAGKDWTLIGQSAPRKDVPAKVDGTAIFGLDVRLPGMLYAAVRMCPLLGGSPGAIDPAPATAMPGVERLIKALRLRRINSRLCHSRQNLVACPAGGTGRSSGLAAQTSWRAGARRRHVLREGIGEGS